ncbi:MAG: phosphoribosylformylglycinamidine synthase subunit PurL [Methanomassiliicoccales archaeon]|nr:MAG: phosphoribosylformylglycinamidine synthase subunit PurL [Methanomassiliicoccales archaeon]
MTIDHLLIKRKVPFELYDVDLFSATDNELKELSMSMGLNLSIEEMKRVQEHFRGMGRLPTDVEVQSIAQAWSEHCCYKSSKVFLREHVFNISNDDVLSKGDAGVMVFDDEHGYALRIESHNHPSAIEPYGGAATGIGGIVRDVLCMGAQPIGLVDPLFFGPIDRNVKVPNGMKSPKYLVGGVVAGIRDYGNRIGIPTIAGGIWFDESYVGNCLVNVGCLGIVKRKELVTNAVKGAGDVLILVGGRTGRDGIHGVTFASAELKASSEEESRGAVQLGDPITKEPLIHACLEVNSLGLIHGMKDLGGGGLSCVVGEMALSGGCGAEVDLDKVPLKEEGLAPWEIWVSESQERMMIAAPKENVKRILEVFDLWDVNASVIGRVVPGKHVELRFKGERVFHLDLEFLTKGPEYCRPSKVVSPRSKRSEVFPKLPSEFDDILLRLLSDPNIASKEWAVRQYDHEVRGSTIVKPLAGRMNLRGPSDATVLKPLPNSFRGLAVAVGVNPWFTSLDPYRGGATSIDEACRNIAAVGGRPHAITNCLNFGNPEKPERLGELREAVAGMGDACRALNLAVPSGNVSLYNEASTGSCLPTVTVMGVGIVEDIRKVVTTDLKKEGDPLYLVGTTKPQFGGSALFRVFGGKGGEVPDVDLKVLAASLESLRSAMDAEIVRACHDVSDGGLAVTLAEMCIGGDLGAEIDLSAMQLPNIVSLFSESNSRWVVEVDKGRELEFIDKMKIPAVKIGHVSGNSLRVFNEVEVLEQGVDVLRERWNSPLWELLG